MICQRWHPHYSHPGAPRLKLLLLRRTYKGAGRQVKQFFFQQSGTLQHVPTSIVPAVCYRPVWANSIISNSSNFSYKKAHLLGEQMVNESAPLERKHPCSPRSLSHSFVEHPQRIPWRHRASLLCQGKPQTQTQSCQWKHVKKQLKETSPAKPKTRGEGLLLARKCRSRAKKYIPVCRSYHPASYTHITWEPWSGTHFSNIPPKAESPLYCLRLKSHGQFYRL